MVPPVNLLLLKVTKRHLPMVEGGIVSFNSNGEWTTVEARRELERLT